MRANKIKAMPRPPNRSCVASPRAEKSGNHSNNNDDDDDDDDDMTNNTDVYDPDRKLPIQAYVPEYLRHVVFPCQGDFCQTPLFHPQLIAQLMAEGFLPIATDGLLLPKLHRQRSVIRLPLGLHVRKSVRRKSSKFFLTVNKDFDGVVQGCHEQHGEHCWLYPPLVAAFRELYDAVKVDAVMIPEKTTCPVRMYSIEIYNDDFVLVGGELGYTVGSIYTSLTGFFRQENAGSVQLAALGRLLCQSGFTIWDLGMDMDYKHELGSQKMPRAEYVKEVKRVRIPHGHVVLPTRVDPVNCKTIIDKPQLSSSERHEPHHSAAMNGNRPMRPIPFHEDKSPNNEP